MSSFAVDRNPCVELPELQVNALVVELMADPCPTAQWYLNDVPITEETGDITVRMGVNIFMACKQFNFFPLYILYIVFMLFLNIFSHDSLHIL